MISGVNKVLGVIYGVSSGYCLLVMFFIVYTPESYAGLFGYDSYSECFAEEKRKRLDRWIAPMGLPEAIVAARGACHDYYEKERQERERATKAQEERRLKRFKDYYGGKCTSAAFRENLCNSSQYRDQLSDQRRRERAREEERIRRFKDYYGGKCTKPAYTAKLCSFDQYLQWLRNN